MCSKESILELHIPKHAGSHIVNLHVVCAHFWPRSTVRDPVCRAVASSLPFDQPARLSEVFWFEAKTGICRCCRLPMTDKVAVHWERMVHLRTEWYW